MGKAFEVQLLPAEKGTTGVDVREGEVVRFRQFPGMGGDPRAIGVINADDALVGLVPPDHWIVASMHDDEQPYSAVVNTVQPDGAVRIIATERPVAAVAAATTSSETVAKKRGCGFWALIGLAVFLGLAVLGAIFGPSPEERERIAAEQAAERAEQSDESSDEGNDTPTIGSNGEEPGESLGEADNREAPRLTGPQRNARRSAEQYLAMTGFSRVGLIQQLSSSAGDGYDIGDATVAVDSLNADWNENAVRSARQYLEMMGFSCTGLIEQLSSSAGDNYTTSEARFGAEQAGAC